MIAGSAWLHEPSGLRRSVGAIGQVLPLGGGTDHLGNLSRRLLQMTPLSLPSALRQKVVVFSSHAPITDPVLLARVASQVVSGAKGVL